MSIWSMENTLNLIEDFRTNPCLWDASSPLFKYRTLKAEVYEVLGKKYLVNASEIEKKIQSLKCQFRREHKKICDAGNQKTSKCNWFGYTPLLFLQSQIERGNKTNGGQIQASDMLDDSMDHDETCSIDSQSQTETENSIVKTEPSNIHNETLQCMEMLIDVVKKRDKFTIYGEYVADKLRTSGRSEMEIHIAQHHIDNVTFNLIMGVYGQGATGGTGFINTSTDSGPGSPNFALKEEKM